MNPTAIVLFIFGASIGFVIGDLQGAATGLATTSGLTLAAEILLR